MNIFSNISDSFENVLKALDEDIKMMEANLGISLSECDVR